MAAQRARLLDNAGRFCERHGKTLAHTVQMTSEFFGGGGGGKARYMYIGNGKKKYVNERIQSNAQSKCSKLHRVEYYA